MRPQANYWPFSNPSARRICQTISDLKESDCKKHRANPNALHCFLPERVYKTIPIENRRKHAFFTLENILSINRSNKIFLKLTPFHFNDVFLSNEDVAKLENRNGEWINPEELDQPTESLDTEEA